MISVKVNNRDFDFWESFDINLSFDRIASTFSLVGLFTSDSKESRALFKPLSFNEVTIFEDGDLILTGFIINNSLSSSSNPETSSVSGYSKTGLLEDCTIPESTYPLQYTKLTLREIAEKVCAPFNITVVIDSSVSTITDLVIDQEVAKETDTVKNFLSRLCNQRNLVLTHDERGRLVITKVKTNLKPVQHFTGIKPVLRMDLTTSGQGMFSESLVMKQPGVESENAGQVTVNNPYVNILRSSTTIQTSGDDNSTELAAKDVLSKQLKGINLVIKCNQITFDNGKIFKPNNIITVQSNRLAIYKSTKFFIQSVALKRDAKGEGATINCVVPEVYNKETPKNIFE